MVGQHDPFDKFQLDHVSTYAHRNTAARIPMLPKFIPRCRIAAVGADR